MALGPLAAAMKAHLEGKPGVSIDPVAPPRGGEPLSLMFKVMGRLFAVLGARSEPLVILKCDPHLVEVLTEQYAGVSHRSHLDRRFWICVALDADVPEEEARRLADASYELVRASLTKRQQAELANLEA